MNAFQIHLDEEFPFLKRKRLLLAVSGGVDSVVLCWLMHLSGIEFGLAHCNFHLRGKESDLDATFVQDLAGQLGRPFHLKGFDTKAQMNQQKGSVQMVARELLPALKREKLRIHNWREKEASRAEVRAFVRDFLYSDKTGLPTDIFSDEEVEEKTILVFDHVLKQYQSAEISPYG